MKHFIIFSAGLLFTLASCSEKTKISPEQEDSFVKYYGNVYEDYGRDVKEVPGKGYAVAGTTNTVKENQKADKDILFLLTDKAGNLLREPQTFGGSYDDEGNSLALTADGGFVIAGTYTDSASQETDVLVVRLDNNGKLLWEKVLPWPGNQTGKQVKISSDSKILIAGESDGKAQFLRLDDAENTSVDSIFMPPSENVYQVCGLEELTDGIWLIGNCSVGENSRFEYLNGMTTLSGYGEPIFGAVENSLGQCLVSPDTLLVCGTKKVGGIQKGILKKVAPSGLEKKHEFPEIIYGDIGESVILKSVRMLDDGQIVLLGTRTVNENSDIVLYLCNRNGNLLETIVLGDNSIQEAGAFEITSDGGFIITGSNLLDNNSMVSLIKLNAKGELQ
jgi:hypothetical protein